MDNTEQNNNNDEIAWTCEKCQNMNLISDYRCLKCNYFNYDAYIKDYENKYNNHEKKNFGKKNRDKPIILKDEFIDYNYKENYEFKREEKHKFIKCWKCGRENAYYKVKCNYCRFPINDEYIPTINKVQLSKYDIMHKIPFSSIINNNNKKKKNITEEKKYREIEIKCNNPIKENIVYKSLGINWKCKFCKKFNKNNTKYCEFCFKNRI